MLNYFSPILVYTNPISSRGWQGTGSDIIMRDQRVPRPINIDFLYLLLTAVFQPWLISFEYISCINLFNHIIQTTIIAVSDDGFALSLKCLNVVYNQ